MGIPVSEQETTIQFSRDLDTAYIWTSDSTIMTKLDKLVETSGCWKIEDVGRVNGEVVSKEYSTLKRLISFRAKPTERVMTEEQKQASAERLRLARSQSE